MSRQLINCSVTTCRFQNNDKCTLDEIKVGNSNEEALEKDETKNKEK